LASQMTQHYGMRISTILSATDKISSDLEYLCSLVEKPDPEYCINDAVAYALAVAALSNQLEFILEELAENDLTEDEEHVKLTEDDVWMLNSYTESAEAALQRLEERCGISLKNN